MVRVLAYETEGPASEMGKGPVGQWGVVFEIFTVGGGVKKIFDQFFPFYAILANVLAIFIILSFQFEIFMGVPPTVNHLKFLWWGVSSKFTMGVPPHHPPCAYPCPVFNSWPYLKLLKCKIQLCIQNNNNCHHWFLALLNALSALVIEEQAESLYRLYVQFTVLVIAFFL